MALSSRSAVVKVEAVQELPEHDEVVKRLADSAHKSIVRLSPIKDYVSEDSRKEADMDENEEISVSDENDSVPELPANWPRIPQIFERRNWDFTTNASSLVNTAASHLELLQTIIEEWCKAEESRPASDVPKRDTASGKPSILKTSASSLQRTAHGRQQLKFKDERPLESAFSMATLSIDGVGAKSEDSGEAKYRTEVAYQVPQLGAEEVIEEVISLLAKLENDRQETLMSLEKERERSAILRSKIDELCMKRIVELPIVVQREHEACARDIAELQWHLNTSLRDEDRIRQKLEVAQVLQNKLKEDITFVKEHVPLMQEKLDLEIEAMKRIAEAQKDTLEELRVTQARYEQVKNKFDEAHRKADEERNNIKKDLSKVQEELSVVTEELSQAKMTYNSYLHQVTEYKQQIEDSQREQMDLSEKYQKARANNETFIARVNHLQKEVDEAESEQKKMDKENADLQLEMDWQEMEHRREERELSTTLEALRDQLRDIVRKNEGLKMDIMDKEAGIKECDRQKAKDDKELDRMERSAQQLEAKFNEASKELIEIRKTHEMTRINMEDEEMRCRTEEQKLRVAADALKRQVIDEINAKATLNARIENDQKDMENFSQNVEEQKAKVAAMAAEIEEAKNAVLQKVEALREKHRLVAEALHKVKSKQSELSKEMKAFYDIKNAQKAELEPQLKSLVNMLQVMQTELEQMNSRSNTMNDEIEDKNKLIERMEKSITLKKKKIQELVVDNQLLEARLKEQKFLDGLMTIELEKVRERSLAVQKDMQGYASVRHKKLKEMTAQMHVEKELNTKLASKYRKLQNAHYLVKSKLNDVLDETVEKEGALRDAKQVHKLQQHMHSALNQYQRSQKELNRAQLKEMQTDTKLSAARLGHLQKDMDRSLSHIENFLHNQLSQDAIKRIASDRVERAEKGEILSDIASVVTDSRPVTVASVSRHTATPRDQT